MNISKQELREAAASLGWTESQAESLWSRLEESAAHSEKPRFTAANVIYYVGALIVIGAMGWFMTKAWEQLGGLGIFGISAAYITGFVFVGTCLWRKEGLRVPAGLLFTIAVCLVPLATYGIERWTGYWPDRDPGAYARFHPFINGSWLIMETATVVAGLIALRFWRFPFLSTPIAYALWFMSMDLSDLIVHGHYRDREFVTMVFGFAMLVLTYLADLRSRLTDLSFWGYLFGLMAFWGGLSAQHSDSELSKFVYCLINLALIFLSVALRRQAFLVFGAMGLFGYLYHLADKVFKDSLYFPFVLSMVGVAVIYAGLLFQRNQKRMHQWFIARILPHIRNLIPARALNT